jgi:hypothetical protein
MSYFQNSELNEQQARDSLLKYYSSSSHAHGTYILAVAVGVFTFIQSNAFVESHITEVGFNIYLSFMISLFSFVGSYLFVRTLYWGVLAGTPIWTQPTSMTDIIKEYKKDYPDKTLSPEMFPVILRLHNACGKDFKRNHPFIHFFNSWIRIFLVVFIPVFILLLIHLNWAFLSLL